MPQTMEFVKANAKLPRGVIFNSVRRGDKWLKLVKPGDVVELQVTEDKSSLGRAVVTQVVNGGDAAETVITHAATNCENIGSGRNAQQRKDYLFEALRRGYPDLKPTDKMTVVYMILLND